MSNPFCLILSGPSGSGKSTTAKKLWRVLDGAPAYLSLDSIKHFVQGARSNDYFLDLARTNALSLTRNYLNAGHTIILDKAFGCYEYVKHFVCLANEMGIASHYFKLFAPLDILIRRVENRRSFSLEEKIECGEWPIPRGDKETATKIYEFFEKNQHPEGIEIDTLQNSPEEVIEIIMAHIKRSFLF